MPVRGEQIGDPFRIATPPAAFGGDTERGDNRGSCGNSSLVAGRIVVVDQPEINRRAGIRTQLPQWYEIGRVASILGHRQMQEIQPPTKSTDQAVGDLDQNPGVL